MKIFAVLVLSVLGLSIAGFAQQSKIDSLLRSLPAMVDPVQRIDQLNSIATYYTRTSVDEAEKTVHESIARAREAHYKKGLADALKIAGVIYYIRSEYTVATEYYYQALKLYEELKDFAGEAKILHNLALIFNLNKEYEQAYTLTQRSLDLKRKMGDSVGVANSLLSLTDYYTGTGKYEQALQTGQNALERYRVLHDDVGISHALIQIGEAYARQKDFTTAISFYKRGLQQAQGIEDYLQIAASYKKFGELFLAKEQYDSARYYLRATISIANRHHIRREEVEAMRFLAACFEKTGRLDSALYYTRALATLEQEVFGRQSKEQIATIQVIYEFEKKEQELGFQKRIVRRQYIAIAGVSLILILAIVLGYKFYGLNKSNAEAKEALLKLNGEINQMNENLESMVRERTEEIAAKNHRLLEYAFFTAHEVRGPLARILGLVELAKLQELRHEHEEIIVRLQEAANELDEVIRIINRKLESTKRL
jgi:tetratricopeptide (TPR) repeat protein